MRHLVFIIAAAFLVWAAGADPAGAPGGSHSAPPASAATPHPQPALPNPSPAALAAAKELVLLQMPERHYAEGIIAVLPTFVGLRLRASGLSAERQRAVLAALADEARKIDETWMREATARLYAETFCEADLTALLAFFAVTLESVGRTNRLTCSAPLRRWAMNGAVSFWRHGSCRGSPSCSPRNSNRPIHEG